MESFIYEGLPARVLFGYGTLERLGEEVERLGATRALVLATPGRAAYAEDAARRLGALSAGVWANAVVHVPVETAEAAREEARRLGADCCVAIGGGSPIGLGKALALEDGLPMLAVPTTYAGSEMTPIWGLTEGGVKRTGRDLRVLPKTVIYDPALTLTLAPAIAGQSGMNALAHCMEALYAENANPVVSLMAEEGIRALAEALPTVVASPGNREARARALYGAWLASVCVGAVGVALHHKLCHTLGGRFDLPHAAVHTVILPHAAHYNREAAPEAMARLAQALGADDGPGGLWDLAHALGAPLSLEAIGVDAADLDEAAALALRNPYYNPRPVTQEGIRALLEDAHVGRRPGSGEG